MELMTFPFILLIISTITITVLAFYISNKKPLMQLQKSFFGILICVLVICYGVLFQSIFNKIFNIDPIYFEYIIYIGTCFLPVTIFLMATILRDTKIKLRRWHLLLFIVPIISLFVLWTNSFHHLFYIEYSGDMSKVVYGAYFYIHTAYTYILLFISMYILLKNSFKTSGIFSKQSILFIIGTSIPILINILGTLKVINMNVYMTPISFSITVIFYALAIFKFNFLGVAPIAVQKIVDKISDSYLVLSEDGAITDYNKTFLTTFKIKSDNLRGKDFVGFLKEKKFSINEKRLRHSIAKAKETEKIISYESEIKKINKIFMVEISSISSKGTFLGIVILLKDITQHKHDIQTIRDNQETLMEKERLASLGQLIGGIAHNLKTPIMSISGAAEGLLDLIQEYDNSIEDPEVTPQDHHEIASDMREWISKIKVHTAYMSDVITAVKGQAVALSEDEIVTFDVDELVKRVNILMKHELKNAIIYLNVDMQVDSSLTMKGDVNNLVQVINNMISNSIQAYNGKPEQNIDMILTKKNNNLVISIRDYAGGLPEVVKKKLFKEMITTKGKNGTGLGLYMSYSNIRAHFNGDITVESEDGKGTTFNIILPIDN